MDSHTQDLWQQVLSIIQTKLSKPSFDTWFKATKATFADDSLLARFGANNICGGMARKPLYEACSYNRI